MKKLKVCWFSSGCSSFVSGYLTKDIDKFLYIDIIDQHPDSLRFLHDCEKILGVNIEILRSEQYDSVESVARKFRFLNSPYGAPCTGMLKKAVRKKWESLHKEYELTYVWGFDCNEIKRAENIKLNFPEFKHEFPLIDNMLNKSDVHAICDRIGIKRPVMYDLGYPNNNCVGCVKGGKGYWNRIRRDFPEVFKSRSKLERELNCSILNGVFLDELEQDSGRCCEVFPECSIMCYNVGISQNLPSFEKFEKIS